jgi:hypothetical protein
MKWLQELTTGAQPFNLTISVLADYSLVHENSSKDGTSMYSLVHEWCQNRQSLDRQVLTVDFVVLFGSVLDLDPEVPRSDPILHCVRIHVPRLVGTIHQLEEIYPRRIRVRCLL